MSNKSANYPEGFSEGSLGWMHLARLITSTMADSWFSSFEKKSVRESFPSYCTEYDSLSEIAFKYSLVVGNEFKLIPDFSSTIKEKDLKLISFVESKSGQTLLDFLEKLEVHHQRETSFLINDEQMLELPSEVSLRIHSFWSTYFGNSFTQIAEMYQDSNGQEYCYWYAPVLYGSRGLGAHELMEILADVDDPTSIASIQLSESEKMRGVLPFGSWSSKIHLPWLAKCLFYLGETPFPSSLASVGRGLAFVGLDEEEFPIPYMRFEQNSQVTTHSNARDSAGNSDRLMLNVLAPQQVQMGWFFSVSDFEKIETILTTITTALIKILSYLEDGYLNHNNPGVPFQFDGVLFSDSQLERRFAQAGVHGGCSHWIPISEVFEKIQETETRWRAMGSSLKSNSAKREDLIWIVDEGVGKAAVGSAINDAIFSHFLPEEEWGGIDWYAQRSLEMDILGETTNSLSNWGISKYLQGDFDYAIKLFESALSRDDKFAEDEASFYLSLIYKKMGIMDKSEEYRIRCDAAGGYEPTYT